MRTIFATNMGYAFFSRRRTLKLTFLEASPGLEFITGDQPLINLLAVDLSEGTHPNELELYYPLTPTFALLIDFDNSHAHSKKRLLTENDVRVYNLKIVAEAEEQFFSASDDCLKNVIADKSA